jgi:hypothetical protein
MFDLTDMAVFTGLLFLRVGIPALIIIGAGYLLKRLDARWEAEAREYQAKHAAEQPEAQPEAPAPQPAVPAPVRKPGKQPTPQPLPFIPPQPANKEQRPGMYAQPGIAATPGVKASAQHCWDAKGCGESKMAKCAAPSHPDQPCWQARLQAEGHVPEECVTCDIFQRYPSM